MSKTYWDIRLLHAASPPGGGKLFAAKIKQLNRRWKGARCVNLCVGLHAAYGRAKHCEQSAQVIGQPVQNKYKNNNNNNNNTGKRKQSKIILISITGLALSSGWKVLAWPKAQCFTAHKAGCPAVVVGLWLVASPSLKLTMWRISPVEGKYQFRNTLEVCVSLGSCGWRLPDTVYWAYTQNPCIAVPQWYTDPHTQQIVPGEAAILQLGIKTDQWGCLL